MANVVLKNVRVAGFEGTLDLTVGDREFVVLCGPDAAVGSAIVRLIAGLANDRRVDVHFDDRRVNDVPPKDRDVALVSHDYEPYPRLSVYENLAIGLKSRQFGEAEIKKRVAAVAEELRLQDRLDAAADTLAPAERPVVALARAMARQPRIYLFDRPLANLAPLDASRGRAAIAGLQQRSSATIVYATNDPAEALALDTRTVILAEGTVQQDANARTVYNFPANLTVASFFGDPPMNLVHGTVKTERDGIAFVEAGEGTISLPLPGPRFDPARDLVGKRVVLGFRPESIGLTPSEGSHRANASFRALVERAEPRGAETDLYLRTGAHDLVCRTARWEQGGRRLQFAIDLEKALLFAAETGLLSTAHA
jgi:multiple sugar transport system ATP-binding protein